MSDWQYGDEFDPDYSRQDALEAIKSGKIKVYSSYPIGQGVFVTPSRMEAESYAGNGKVYEQVVDIDDIAWIDPTQGQYAKVEADSSESAFSMPEDGQYSLPDGQDGTDYTAEMDALDEQFRNGEITRDEYLERINEFHSKAGEEYGTIPKGETVTGNEDFSNPVPKSVDGKKNVKRHVRTIIEGGELTPEMVEVTKQQILSGDLSYTPTSNSANMQYADRAIQAGTAQGIWDGIANGDEVPSGI